MTPATPCPCDSGRPYAACCGPLHAGAENAASPQALMRSRYAAYVLRLEDYLLTTWHPATRPSELDLAADTSKWLGLTIKAHALQDAEHGTVEFVARYRIAGRGHRLHERSRFTREDGRWYYVDGDFLSA